MFLSHLLQSLATGPFPISSLVAKISLLSHSAPRKIQCAQSTFLSDFLWQHKSQLVLMSASCYSTHSLKQTQGLPPASVNCAWARGKEREWTVESVLDTVCELSPGTPTLPLPIFCEGKRGQPGEASNSCPGVRASVPQGRTQESE